MGHRGAAGLAPENTLAGFRKAAGCGVSWVELDVHLTGDGVPVLSHDDDLQRVGGVGMRVTRMTAADVGQVDVGRHFAGSFAGETIPTLESALSVIGGLGLGVNIEIKRQPASRPAVVEAVGAAVRAAWPAAAPAPLLSSFDVRLVAEAARRLPGLPRALIATRLPSGSRRVCAELGCVSLHLRHDAATERRAAMLHRDGVQLAVYTVNDADTARRQWAMGVDCVITDRPDRLLAARPERGEILS